MSWEMPAWPSVSARRPPPYSAAMLLSDRVLFLDGEALVIDKPEGLPVTVVRGKDGRVAQAEKGQLFAEDVAELARWV